MKKKCVVIIEAIIIIALCIVVIFQNISMVKKIEKMEFSQEFENRENLEVEKKWLINVEEIPYDLKSAEAFHIEQTYINYSPEIRVRNINYGQTYVMTVKLNTSLTGFVREEREYTITEEEYNELLNKKVGQTIYKTRYRIPDTDGILLEFDIYEGEFEGLAYLEREFKTIEDANKYEEPEWIAKDVTTDLSYKNGNLARYGLPDSYYEYMDKDNK